MFKFKRRGVGYKKPPRDSQFKPGRSGNPTGRPKGSKNFNTDMREELDSRMGITENGKHKRLTKQRVIVKRMVNQAVAGDPRITPMVLKAGATDEGAADASEPEEDRFEPVDELVLKSIIQRIRQMNELEPTDSQEISPPAPPTPPEGD